MASCLAPGSSDAAIEKIRQKLVQIKKAYPDNPGITTCFQTMQKYLANVYRDPSQDKFRSIKLSNAAFQQRVAAFDGSIEVLEMCGFKVRLLVQYSTYSSVAAFWHTQLCTDMLNVALSLSKFQGVEQRPLADVVVCGIIHGIEACFWDSSAYCLQRSDDGNTLTMSREDAQPEVLTAAGSELDNAINNPFFGAL